MKRKVIHALQVIATTGFLLVTSTTAFAQSSKMSFSTAFNLLNSGSSSSGSGYMPSPVLGGNYTKKATIGYGIPFQIGMEQSIVKANLSSAIANDPDQYNSLSEDVQAALWTLAYGEFVKISNTPVNVKLEFRFNPAQLYVYGSIQSDFIDNGSASPNDPLVYKAPQTAVSGTKIIVLKK